MFNEQETTALPGWSCCFFSQLYVELYKELPDVYSSSVSQKGCIDLHTALCLQFLMSGDLVEYFY